MNSITTILKSAIKMLKSTYNFSFLISVILIVLGVNGRSPQKIKGGTDAKIENYPFVVTIKDGPGLCGGTLISEKHVLTAAHCVTRYETSRTEVHRSSLQIVLPHHDMENIEELKVYSVDHMRVHEKWMGQKIEGNLEADIAILTLNESVSSLGIGKVANLTDIPPKKGMEGIILGWGSHSSGGWQNRRMQEAKTIIIDYDYCKLYHDQELADRTFCALGKNDDVSFCDGDSGGPFISEGKIVGIISYTWDCSGYSANMFTDVFAYRSWIHRILRDEKA